MYHSPTSTGVRDRFTGGLLASCVGVAQLAEYPALTRNVVGSIPTAHTNRQKLAFASSRA